MSSGLCEIVKFHGKTGFLYTGLLFRAVGSRRTVVHVHGSCGDFISFGPLKAVAEHYCDGGTNLLTFNLKGHDCVAEGIWKNGGYGYVGGSISSFNECVEDIESAIAFCYEFSDAIVLQGHSLGCDRIVHYQLQMQQFFPSILLSPCDSYKLQELYVYPKTVEEHIDEIEQFEEKYMYQILPPGVYGVRNRGECYDIPMTKSALLSIMTGPPYQLFRIDSRIGYRVDAPCLACIGSRDDLQTHRPQEMYDHLRDKFSTFAELTLNADHELEPEGEALGMRLSEWVVSHTKI
jgi:hypothetical protein